MLFHLTFFYKTQQYFLSLNTKYTKSEFIYSTLYTKEYILDFQVNDDRFLFFNELSPYCNISPHIL